MVGLEEGIGVQFTTSVVQQLITAHASTLALMSTSVVLFITLIAKFLVSTKQVEVRVTLA